MLFFSLLLPGAAIYHLITKNNWLKKEYSKQEVYVQQKDAFEKLGLYTKTVESNSRGYALTGNEQFLRNFNILFDSINSVGLQIKASAITDETIAFSYANSTALLMRRFGFFKSKYPHSTEQGFSSIILFRHRGLQLI
ncbi:MAG: hypothetical protein IPK31_20580 [Chitinophagaceae bacterium]|nr:hypothetical protein [Chitinophagaceae bacterium]